MGDDIKKPDLDSEFRHGNLVIKENTMAIGNDIHQISSISTIAVRNLSYTDEMPWYWPTLIVVGIALLILPSIPDVKNYVPQLSSTAIRFWGVVSLVTGIIGAKAFESSSHHSRHSLTVILNAGNRFTIISTEAEFLKKIALSLRLVMTGQKGDLTVNLDNRNFFDNVSKSTIAIGNVNGDISNNV